MGRCNAWLLGRGILKEVPWLQTLIQAGLCIFCAWSTVHRAGSSFPQLRCGVISSVLQLGKPRQWKYWVAPDDLVSHILGLSSGFAGSCASVHFFSGRAESNFKAPSGCGDFDTDGCIFNIHTCILFLCMLAIYVYAARKKEGVTTYMHVSFLICS